MPCWSGTKEIRSREFFPLKKLEKEVRVILMWDQCSENKRQIPINRYEVKAEMRVDLVKTQPRVFQSSFLRKYFDKGLVSCLIDV